MDGKQPDVSVIDTAHARSSSLSLNGNDYEILDFVGSYTDVSPDRPQAFLVRLRNPGGVIRAHFHEVDQFQVVLGGSGRLGPTPISRGAVHYADRHTTYGPITAGASGLEFLTLRASSASGSQYMPESRARKGPRGEHFMGRWTSSAMADGSTLLGETSTGAACRHRSLAPGSSWRVLTSGPAVEYVLALEGPLLVDAQELHPLGVVALTNGGATTLRAGDVACSYLHVWFPDRD
jgi:hypothetical protein